MFVFFGIYIIFVFIVCFMDVKLLICGVFDKSDIFYCEYLYKFVILVDFNYIMYVSVY